ncbi:MAG: HAMP domain-containing protein [Lachnospiraceae bacterium]|nr:HAMP domain-containing protein [Lachnospiraceae bacterium]
MDRRHSIRTNFSLIFLGLLISTIGLILLINNLFLEDYYLSYQKKRIIEGYRAIDRLLNTFSTDSDEFKTEFSRVCSAGNFSVAVVNQGLTIIASSSGNEDFLVKRLLEYVFDYNEYSGSSEKPKKKKTVIAKTDEYELTMMDDPKMKMGYLDLWGTLSDGLIIIMRVPLSGIQDSVWISNRFTSYVGLFMALISGLIIWIVTGRVTRPIQELAAISKKMANLDFNARYESGGKNEIAELGNNINILSQTLEKTISDLHTVNNELKRDIEKKEQIDSMRIEFISNVTHELKTPIALIQGYAEGLKDEIEEPENRDFYCDVIIDEAGKMNRMVMNLLRLNQLEFGEAEIRMERFNLTELIKNCIHSADIMLKSDNINVSFDEEEQVFVWSDELRTEEVFMNYFINAIHHAAPAGDMKRIEIKHKLSQGREDDEKNLNIADKLKSIVRISVFNTGSPIPEESIERLWDKFYKVDKARTREYGGSGIGLSIVKANMNALNHDFGVINYENGVEFWFELDAA